MHYSSGKFIREGISTQNPEYYGWTLGNSQSFLYKAYMTMKSRYFIMKLCYTKLCLKGALNEKVL